MSRQINKFIAPGISVDKISAGSSFDMGNNKIINVQNPTNPQDVATKDYVDNSVGGSSAGASGAIQFSNGSGGFLADASNLSWDNTNKRLGIGVAPSILSVLNVKVPSGANLNPIQVLSSTDNVLASIVSNGANGDGIFAMSANSEIAPDFTVVLRTVGDSHFTGGNVGIGTSSPTQILDVVTSQNNVARLFSSATSGQVNNLILDSNFNTGLSLRNDVATTGMYIGNSGGNTLDFQISNLETGGSLSIRNNNLDQVVINSSDQLLLGSSQLRWPSSDGTSGQVLETNGSGVLSWATRSTDRWEKFTVDYTDALVASNQHIISTGVVLGPNDTVDAVIMSITTEFLSPSASAITGYVDPSNGTPFTGSLYAGGILSNPAGSKFRNNPITPEFGATRTLEIGLQSDVNLDDMTAGSVDFYFKISKLP